MAETMVVLDAEAEKSEGDLYRVVSGVGSMRGMGRSVDGVMLFFEPTLKQGIQMVMEAEGHHFVASRDPDEVWRELTRCVEQNVDQSEGESAGRYPRCLLLADNFLVNPAARETLARLKAIPALRQHVRVIGLSAWSGQAVADGLVDEVIPLPFTVAMLLDAIGIADTDRPVDRSRAP